jgi:hypothetical protein
MRLVLNYRRAKAILALAEYWSHSESEVADFVLALGFKHLERDSVLKNVIQQRVDHELLQNQEQEIA